MLHHPQQLLQQNYETHNYQQHHCNLQQKSILSADLPDLALDNFSHTDDCGTNNNNNNNNNQNLNFNNNVNNSNNNKDLTNTNPGYDTVTTHLPILSNSHIPNTFHKNNHFNATKNANGNFDNIVIMSKAPKHTIDGNSL